MKNRLTIIIASLVAVIAGVALVYWYITNEWPVPEPADTSNQNARVTVTEDGFSPETLVVKLGTTVTWTSRDDEMNHKITSNPHPSHTSLPELESGNLQDGSSYNFRFDSPGTFEYHDHLHPTMNGKVVVRE